jgi:hypothetical protein
MSSTTTPAPVTITTFTPASNLLRNSYLPHPRISHDAEGNSYLVMDLPDEPQIREVIESSQAAMGVVQPDYYVGGGTFRHRISPDYYAKINFQIEVS